MIVAEKDRVQSESVIAQREVFHSRSAVEVVVACRQHQVPGSPVRRHIGTLIGLVSNLGAEIPLSYSPYCLYYQAPVREEEMFLFEGGAVDEIDIHEEIVSVELIAQSYKVHLPSEFVFDVIDAPYCLPPGIERAVPVKVVGIPVLVARGDGRRHELKDQFLAGQRRVACRHTEGVVLIKPVAEGTVIVNVDRRRVDFIAANEYCLFSGREGQFREGIPFQV